MTLRILSLCISLATLAACNFGPKTPTDDSGLPGDDTGSSSSGPSIADIQTGAIADGEEVQLEGVIATSAYTGTQEGFFVQDAGGGQWSGIYIFVQGAADGLFIEPGDELTLTGRVTEFYDWTEFTIGGDGAVEVTGTGTPVSDSVDPCAITDWEPYESGLISLGATEAVAGPNRYGEVELACGLVLDDFITAYAGEEGATWSNVTGLLGYSYETWRLFPRGEADLEGYVPGAGPEVVSCADVQTGVVEEDQQVILEGVVATSEVLEDEGFFIQDAGGGEWSGLFVYIGDRAPDLVITVGDVLTVTGRATEFYDWTELSIDGEQSVSVTGSAEPTIDLIDACDVDDWEVWESNLVDLGARTATSDPSQYGEVELDCGPNIDDLLYRADLAEGDTYEGVIGTITYSYGAFKILPRGPDDIVGRVPGEGGVAELVTVTQIQTGDVSEGSDVQLDGVIVTSAINSFTNGFFVSDPAGGASAGIYVYSSAGFAADAFQIGDEVSVTGEYVEYYDLSQVSRATVTVTGSGAVPAPVVLTEAPSDWEPYEGVQVTLEGLAITSDADQYGEFTTSWGALLLGDLFGQALVGNGDSFTSVTGHISYGFSSYKLEVDASGDFVE